MASSDGEADPSVFSVPSLALCLLPPRPQFRVSPGSWALKLSPCACDVWADRLSWPGGLHAQVNCKDRSRRQAPPAHACREQIHMPVRGYKHADSHASKSGEDTPVCTHVQACTPVHTEMYSHALSCSRPQRPGLTRMCPCTKSQAGKEGITARDYRCKGGRCH